MKPDAIKFFLRSHQGKQKAKPIIVMAIFDAKFYDRKFFFSTGEHLDPAEWQKVKGKKYGLPKTPKNETLVDHLDELRRRAKEWMNEKIGVEELTKKDKEDLNKRLKGANSLKQQDVLIEAEPPKTLADLWRDYLASIKDTVEWRTYNSYSNSFETSANRPKEGKKKKRPVNFCEFLKTQGLENILPEQFKVTHYNLYRGYLKTNVKPNTAAKRQRHFKQFLAHIVNDLKITVGFDIEKITYKETAGLKLSLSETELQAYIDAADLPAHLVKVRDLAVLQCSTGLRISDRKRIDKNIRGDKIVIEAQKTRSKMEIPITPQVRAILEKYNYELPELSEQKYREGIKSIHKKLFPKEKTQVREGNGYKDVFVWEEISSHDMVRTFISLSAERGMDIPSIAVITGKSVATLLRSYLVVSQKVAEKKMVEAWGSSHLKIA